MYIGKRLFTLQTGRKSSSNSTVDLSKSHFKTLRVLGRKEITTQESELVFLWCWNQEKRSVPRSY